MPAESYDEWALRALDAYRSVIVRVAGEFATRRARITPVAVDLDRYDSVAVQFLRPGRDPEWMTLPAVEGAESAVVALAEVLQEKTFDGSDNTWPGCVRGHPHPPEPAIVAGTAVWRCPASRSAVAPIGHPAPGR